MKNKINVDVLVPAINETYSLFIPINKKVGEIINLLNQAINELTEGAFPISDNLSLVDLYSGDVYDVNVIVKNNDILDGSKLVLL